MQEYRLVLKNEASALSLARFVQSAVGGVVRVFAWRGEWTVVWEASVEMA